MTLPIERTRAIVQTRAWMVALLKRRKLLKTELRKEILALLRHYPTVEDMRNPERAFSGSDLSRLED